jgi:hypothetical protein
VAAKVRKPRWVGSCRSGRGEVRLSYDLQVFAQESLGIEDLRRLIVDAGLGVDDGDETQGLEVARGVTRRYSFTLGTPVRVEPEDVPDEVTAVLLAPSVMYELLVEGSAATEIPHAIRFARRLADASSGVVLDQQTGRIWVRGKLRSCAPVRRGTIDIVRLCWYTQVDHDPAGSTAAGWLRLARRHLPEALPRRFGPVEPLAMKLDIDGPDAFVRVVATEDTSVYFKASSPCVGGNLAGGAAGPGVHSHALSVHREPLHDPRWRDALRQLFVEFALTTGAFFACAEVIRGVDWSGRGIGYTARTERTTYLAPRGRWAGLLPYPAWWTWFGPRYVPLVVDHLRADQVHTIGDNLFHAYAGQPLDRDHLAAAATPATTPTMSATPRRGLRGLFSPRENNPPISPQLSPQRRWLPDELLATVQTTDPQVYNPPLTAATTMPPELRTEG